MKEKKFDVVIACGGLGSRIKSLTKECPKPLFPIKDVSTIERCFHQLKNYSFKKIFLTLGYKNEFFYKTIRQLERKLNIQIEIFIEQIPLGECGALWEIKEKLSEEFIFLNGDLIFSIDFDRLIYFHQRLKSNLTLVTHTSDHPEDSDLVSAPNGTLITELFFKGSQNKYKNNAYLGNSGICIIRKDLLNKIEAPKKREPKSVFNYIVRNTFNLKINIYSYNTTEYIKDMGTPSRFKVVENDIEKKKLILKNYLNSQKALFLDRDNTLIKCPIGFYILDSKDIYFIDKNISKISIIAKEYNFVCLVTNQPALSMGKLSLEKLNEINSTIVKYCLTKGLKIDVITFCPHHPHIGFKNEVLALKRDCFCRKPNPGLFFEQAFLRNINLGQSLMIGDSENDSKSAKNSGCKFIKVDNL